MTDETTSISGRCNALIYGLKELSKVSGRATLSSGDRRVIIEATKLLVRGSNDLPGIVTRELSRRG